MTVSISSHANILFLVLLAKAIFFKRYPTGISLGVLRKTMWWGEGKNGENEEVLYLFRIC